jgi:hypothetical protein
MNVRKAQPSDAARLAELREVLGYPIETELMERLLSKPEHLVLAAESEQSGVVGWIHAAEHDLLEVGTTREIFGRVVAADRGVAA